jgi:hypothetical protein
MYAPVSENSSADIAALSSTVSEQELMVKKNIFLLLMII